MDKLTNGEREQIDAIAKEDESRDKMSEALRLVHQTLRATLPVNAHHGTVNIKEDARGNITVSTRVSVFYRRSF